MKKFNNQNDDTKVLFRVILVLLFVIWLCCPPINKFLQFMFWTNNTKFFVAKVFKQDEAKSYVYHRNNAAYLARMYPNKPEKALAEMDNAINACPTYIPDSELNRLFADRAKIKLLAGDKKGALDDFMKSDKITFADKLPVAILLAEKKKYKMAKDMCKDILDAQSSAFSGYACLAEVYRLAGKPETAIRLYDMVIDKKKNNFWAYQERARVKQSVHNSYGAEEDFAKAKQYAPRMKKEDSYFEDIITPKTLSLEIL